MVGVISYRPISLDQTDVQALSDEAWGDGYPFVERMLNDWRSGHHRFDGPGEKLIGAFDDGKVIGFCGLSRDLYIEENAGRIRHLYVSLDHRHMGIARGLLERALEGAAEFFPRIRLRATPASRSFYERHGFEVVDEPEATHSLRLR